ncbi:5'-methylthioadenosine/S-adenosylhomocysteine nucleosidase [Candidatus Epulonipiscioides gigas]|nr:5'-methylthioadenosine/S-adenosylhomocysteine nucleosidase [Epulopiscium sp. SCG-C07WGA-EpuloA2]
MHKIGIIGAMEEEVITLKKNMKISKIINKASMEFVCGEFKNKEIVVVKCGIGKVNSAICAQILADIFEVDCIINTGVAGALHPDLNIGDIVISSDTVQHDIDTTAFGDPRGIIPRMDNSYFEADQSLINLVKEISENKLNNKIYIGRVASGDQFIANLTQKEDIYTTFNAYCAEMEGAAIAQTCYLNKIPFVIIRSISDRADGSAEVNFSHFTEKAAANAVTILSALLEKLS